MASRVLEVQIIGNPAQLEAALGRAAAASKGFGDRMAATGRTMTAVGRTMTSAITLPVLAAAGASVKMAVDFQRSMELIHTQANVSQKAVESMSKSVLKMAESVGTTPETLSQGLFHLASQGLRGAKAMDALRIAAEGAKVGQANLEDVTNALGAVLVSGIKGAQNMTQAMGALNAVVGAGDMHMQDLADAMGTGLAAKAAFARVSLRDVGAALAVFGDNNIRGAEAGTLLSSALRIMAGPSKAAAKELATVGISATQLAQDMQSPGGLVKAIEDLKAHIKDMPASELPTFFNRAFGGRQSGGVQILIDQLERLKTKVKAVGDGANSFGAAWQATTQTAAFKFDRLKAALASTAITIGNQLLPMVLQAAKTFEGWVQAFDKLSPSTKKLIEKIALVAAAIGPALMVGGRFLTFFSDLSNLLPLVASPMGALAAAVAVLGGALLAAEYAPKQFQAVLEKMGLSAKDAKRVVDDLRTAFEVIKTVVQAVWPVIKATILASLKIIEAAVKAFNDLLHGRWSALWGDLKSMVGAALTGMVNVAKAELTLLLNTAGRLAEAIGKGIVKHILDPIAKLASELWNWLVKEITSAVNKVVGWVKSEAGRIGHAIVDGIVGGLGGLGGAVTGAIGGALHGALSLGGKALGWLGIGSPSKWTRDHIGKPIGQGVVQGAKEALAELSNAINSTLNSALARGSASTAAGLRRLINAAVAAVRSGSPAVQAAMRNLANGVLDAFDRQTQTGLDKIRSNLEKKLNQITQATNAQLAKIARETSKYDAAQMAPVNALSAQMQAQQRAHDLAAANQAILDAQAQLAADQASGTATPAQLAADQRAIDDAKYQLQMLQEQYQLEDMKAAANKKITAEKKKQAEEDKKIRAEAEKKKRDAKNAAKSEAEQWRERRKEERKQLVAYIADLRSSLEGMTKDWQKYGTKSGKVYAEGLKKAEADIKREVEAISGLIRSGLGMDIHVSVSQASGGMPSHAAGGPTRAGLAVLHDGEYVLQRTAANAIGRHNLDMLNRLPHFANGGPVGTKLNPNTGLPDTPAFRASAMYVNDGGIDKNDTAVLTALIGALGPRAQAQAAMRRTTVAGFGELHQGSLRASLDPKMVAAYKARFPDLVFEDGTPGQQISAGAAMSRIPGDPWGALGALVQSSAGLTGSLLEHVFSHAIHRTDNYLTKARTPAPYYWSPPFSRGGGSSTSIDTGDIGSITGKFPAFAAGGIAHFAQGGRTLANGLAYLHRNEAIVPLDKPVAGGGTVHLHVEHLHVTGDLSDPAQRRQTARLLLDDMHSELRRKSQRVNTLGLK